MDPFVRLKPANAPFRSVSTRAELSAKKSRIESRIVTVNNK